MSRTANKETPVTAKSLAGARLARRLNAQAYGKILLVEGS
jgi:hypothetical protein